jgi:peptidyl-prolyl cis-trans isomerase A (cyclophilin A)
MRGSLLLQLLARLRLPVLVVVPLLLVVVVPVVGGTDPRRGSAHAVAVEMGLEAAPPRPPSPPPRPRLDTVDLRPTPPIQLTTLTAGGSESGSPSPVSSSPQKSNPLAAVKPITLVRFNTTRGTIFVDVHYDWAPLGAAQFLSLVMAGFYDGCYIFRVVQGFVAQTGINSDPHVQSDYAQQSIEDDPSRGHSNALGTLSFATSGTNTRATQFFWNLMDNARLDAMGFTPFGKVHDGSGGGLQVMSAFNSEYGERPDQTKLREQGAVYLEAQFPHLDRIISARILSDLDSHNTLPVPENIDKRFLYFFNQ